MRIDFELLEGLDGDSPVTTGFRACGQGWLQMTHVTQPLIGYHIIFNLGVKFPSSLFVAMVTGSQPTSLRRVGFSNITYYSIFSRAFPNQRVSGAEGLVGRLERPQILNVPQ
jgi:hypothetical protein